MCLLLTSNHLLPGGRPASSTATVGSALQSKMRLALDLTGHQYSLLRVDFPSLLFSVKYQCFCSNVTMSCNRSSSEQRLPPVEIPVLL